MEMSDAVRVLDALAQESRLAILRYLIRVGPEGAAAGQIAASLALHAATLSFHLGALREAQLVVARRASRSIIYTAHFGRMSELLAFLTENCCSEAPARHGGAARAAQA